MYFVLYDVFCNGHFSGNPAVVVRGETPFRTDVLVTLAREFNAPETCGYWLADGVPHGLFATSEGMIAACGHATLAMLADVALTSAKAPSGEISYVAGRQRRSCGRFVREDERTVTVAARWPSMPCLRKVLPRCETARLLGCTPEDIRTDLPFCAYDSGIVNGLVPLMSQRVLTAIRPDFGTPMKDYFKEHGLDDLHLYALTRTSEECVTARTRNVFPYGVREEAATGTASVSLARALGYYTGHREGKFVFIQGTRRKGTIKVVCGRGDDRKQCLWLEGRVKRLMSGQDLILPHSVVR